MIHVFLDTTVFRDDPLRRKAPFKVIERLAELGKVEIHVSDISRREFITQQEHHFDEQIGKLLSAIKDLRTKIPNEQLLAGLQREVATVQAKRETIATEFDGWLSRVNAHVHPIAEHHGASVVEKYFMGLPPFTKVKSRNDYPDAFIWEAVVDVAKEAKAPNLVTNDGPLSNNIADIPGVTAHKSLHDFVAISSLEDLLKRTENLDKILSFFASDATKTANYIASPIVDRLTRSNLTPFSDDCEATILSVGPLRDLVVNILDVEDYGEGLFVLPFSGKAECLIQYYMLKADYWGLPPESTPRSAADWNDHVFEIEEYYDLAISGTLGFQIEPEALDGRIRHMKDVAQIFAAANVAVEDILSVEFVDDSTMA